MIKKQLIWTGEHYEIVTTCNSTDMAAWKAHKHFSHRQGLTEGLPSFKGQRARENGQLLHDFSIGFMAEVVLFSDVRFKPNGDLGDEFFVTNQGEVFK